MFKNVLFGLIFVCSTFAANQAKADIILFNLQGTAGAGLLPGNENPANATAVTGGETGSGISFDNVTKILTVNVGWGAGSGFTGSLTGTATAAHIHSSSGFTTNGGVVFGLDGPPFAFNSAAASGSITGNTVALSAGQEALLLSNQFYINVHTAANAGGEIRGNLIAVPEPSSMAFFGAAMMASGLMRRRKVQV